MSGSKICVGIIQADVVLGEIRTNRDNAASKIAALARAGCDVVVLPELWETGYCFAKKLALPTLSSQAWLQQMAKQFGVIIVGGSTLEFGADGKIFNTTYIVAKDGRVIGKYQKRHLFAPMAEDQYLTSGVKTNQFELPTANETIAASSLICYDVRFSAWVAASCTNHAAVLFVVAQWPKQRIAQWRQLVVGRAVEQQAYVVAVNRVGKDDANTFGGNSLIVNPLGEIIAQANTEEQLLHATLDIAVAHQLHARLDVVGDEDWQLVLKNVAATND